MRVVEKWREQVQAGELPPDVRKTVFPEMRALKAEGDDDVRRASFVISTAAEDRDGDVIDTDGWELDAYRENPVILWAHDAKQLPIARSASIEVRDGALRSVAEWPAKGVNAFADTVYEYVRGGFLRGASVGFHPLEAEPRGDGKGVHFKRQELYEYSILPIPAHREALAEAKAAGLDPSPMIEWAESLLEKAEASGLWVPRFQIEKALRAVGAALVSVPAAPSEGATLTGGHAAAGAGSTKSGHEDEDEDPKGSKPEDEDDEGKQEGDEDPDAGDSGEGGDEPEGDQASARGVAAIIASREAEREEMEQRWELESALIESLDSIEAAGLQDEAKREAIRQSLEEFVELYVPAREAAEVEDLAKEVFPDEDEDGRDEDGKQDEPEGDEPESDDDPANTPADEPPADAPADDEADEGGSEVEAGLATLQDELGSILSTEDEGERAEALRTALEAFAAVVMGAGAPPDPEETDDVLAEAAGLLEADEDEDEGGEGMSLDEVRAIVAGAAKAAIGESRTAKTGRLPD